jgi:uncharacterized protein YodC (DUF2158 family)
MSEGAVVDGAAIDISDATSGCYRCRRWYERRARALPAMAGEAASR